MARDDDRQSGRRARRWAILATAGTMLFAGLPTGAATAVARPAETPQAQSNVAPSEDALASASHGAYHALSPVRLLDTRETGQALGPTGTLDLRVTGMAGVPTAGVEAVVLDVVATNGSSSTYLTIRPTGAPATATSNVNAEQGQTVSNLVITTVGANGKITLFNWAGTTDVVVDVEGWFGSLDLNSNSMASTLRSVNPERLLDTRVSGNPIGPDETMELAVTGLAGVPATGVDAVVLDVVATEGTSATYLDLHPSGEQPNTTSNVNAALGATVSNLVFAKVGADGKVAIHNHSGTTQVVVDIQGWFGSNDGGVAVPGEYHGLDASRLLDTRTSASPIGPDDSTTVRVTGVGGVPSAGVDAVVLNVVATEGTSATYLDLFPTGETQNTTSNINAAAGATVSNLVVAKVGTDGTVTIYNRSGTTHVVIDVQGWFGATS
ncbi:MAG: subtilase family protease, partial [Ilumatobacteraceae bacterium]|nr:subtilase family protease [Ilumatobacteraceae bacterium]